ncbi:hypothetical protein ACQP00_13450 [Dactylosporangium sp. CS-047395]|uniref:hypothetical protein n=1 Tax=Dactylosporangium sp. CS-047395 TaxID=3239936 RepID=UPI003D93D9DF
MTAVAMTSLQVHSWAFRDAVAHGSTPTRSALAATDADEIAEADATADDDGADNAIDDDAVDNATDDNATADEAAGATTPPSARDGAFRGTKTREVRAWPAW